MRKLRVTVDLDNVLNDLTETLLEIYNKDANDNLTIEEITKYKIDNFTKEGYKISEYFQSPALWMRVNPLYQSHEYLKIINDDYDLRVVSASHLGDMPVKYRWIKTYFNFLKREQIWTVFDKDWIDSDVHIDDGLFNLVASKYHKICLDYPWNRDVNDKDEGIVRCFNWGDIFKEIKRFDEERELKREY